MKHKFSYQPLRRWQIVWNIGRILFARAQDEGYRKDTEGVEALAQAMKQKLAQKRLQGRGGWHDPKQCSAAYLSHLLREHVEKGDPVDVANFCMMLWNRGERIEKEASKPL